MANYGIDNFVKNNQVQPDNTASTQPVSQPQRTIIYGEDIVNNPIPHQDGADLIRLPGHQGSFTLDNETLSHHLLITGGVGVGKTNVFNHIIKHLLKKITRNDVVIIFDTKGDFYGDFYEPYDSHHLLIGHEKCYKSITRSWNIFDELRDEDNSFSAQSELMAKEIAKQLYKDRHSTQQPFFSDAAEDLTAKVLIHLMRCYNRGEISYLNTSDFVKFMKEANAQTFYDMVTSPDNPDFANAVTYFGDPSRPLSGQALGVFGTMNVMINSLFTGVFAEPSTRGNLSMRQLVRQKNAQVLFVEYDLAAGSVLGPMYRILFDCALKEALSQGKQKGNVYLVIDEFKLLPDLEHIDDALNFGRGLGVKVMAGLQSINQLYDVYGEQRGKVLVSGFMNCFCFKTFDIDTRQFICQHFGQLYENIVIGGHDVQRAGTVVEDWHILDLRRGEAFISLYDQPPFKFYFNYFKK